jgi:diguanylate cyclase (GGDEF)-like protein/PAS domain S-box-containing protein
MYHCKLKGYLLNADQEFQDIICGMKPMEHFEHSFSCSDSFDEKDLADADITIAVLDKKMMWERQGDITGLVQELCHGKKSGADLILCLSSEAVTQVAQMDLEQISDIWRMPMTAQEIAFHFLRWQQQNSVRKDLWLTGQYLDTTINSVPHLIWYKDKKGAHMKVNDSFCRAVNKTHEQIHGRGHYYIWDLDPEEYAKGEFICMESEDEVMEKKETCIFDENVKIGDEMRLFTTYKTPLFDLDVSVMGTVGVANDVTQEKRYEAMIVKRANTDFLTGLYNRRYLMHYIETALKEPMVFYYLDLDNFKGVNDHYGHQAGDQALVLTSDVLKKEMPQSVIARIGGDEFLVVQTEALDAQAIEEERLRLEQMLNQAFSKEVAFRNVSASIGTAYSPEGVETDLDRLLEEADHMMYREKKEKKR